MDFAKLFSLEGKIALITGGSRGIGKMLLEGYLPPGASGFTSPRARRRSLMKRWPNLWAIIITTRSESRC